MQPFQHFSQLSNLDLATPGGEPGSTSEALQDASTAELMLAYNPYLNPPFPTPGPSTPFSPTHEHDGELPDVVLITQDQAHFYAHSRRLVLASTNYWGMLFASPVPPQIINVPEDANTLRLALHLVYGSPFLYLGPSLESIEGTLVALTKYGVVLDKLVASCMPLYHLILSHAPYRPIETYALAAWFHLEPVAVAASSHLLAFDTSTLTDELTIKMGALYFKRLLDLHKIRRTALKTIVLRLPQMHPPTDTCGEEGQRELMSICASAAAELAWDSLPNLSTYALQSVFEKPATDLRCRACKAVLQQHINEVTTEWSAVKRTI
ncbi:hypothetical protein C8Q80DRAFT_161612 [Daedaleopsis nitida]|nr:hypothetical protein C8Q80DRAFT_161612 [Daedaleopsis nitida]